MRLLCIPLVVLVTPVVAQTNPKAALPCISDQNAFPSNYRKATVIISRYLSKHGQDPKLFHAEIISEKRGVLRVDLWHQDILSYEFQNSLGDPTGKCRTVRFNTFTQKIISINGWR